MTGVTGVKFLLSTGAFVSVGVRDSEANDIMRRWNSGLLTGIVSGTDPMGIQWGVDSKQIQAVHTFNWNEHQQAVEFNKLQIEFQTNQMKQQMRMR